MNEGAGWHDISQGHVYNPLDRGNKDIFTYDNRGLLANKTIGNLTTICYNYNGNGKVNRMIDGESKTYNFNYDGHDRLKEVIDPLGNKVSYGYDAGSNVTAFAGAGSISNSMDITSVLWTLTGIIDQIDFRIINFVSETSNFFVPQGSTYSRRGIQEESLKRIKKGE